MDSGRSMRKQVWTKRLHIDISLFSLEGPYTLGRRSFSLKGMKNFESGVQQFLSVEELFKSSRKFFVLNIILLKYS